MLRNGKCGNDKGGYTCQGPKDGESLYVALGEVSEIEFIYKVQGRSILLLPLDA